MGKRSDFDRLPKDQYDAPAAAVVPLLPHLEPGARFIEPCTGAGHLIQHLRRAGHVLARAYDLPIDARSHQYDVSVGAAIVTNPPFWGRPADLHPLIINLSDQADTWLLMPGDWLFNRSSAPLMPRLRMAVAVGRVKWIPNSEHTGKDNCAWMLFSRPSDRPAMFVLRTLKGPNAEAGRGRGSPFRDSAENQPGTLLKPCGAVPLETAVMTITAPEARASRTLRALDLFCGAGGVARGFNRAGFHVTGVDIGAQKNYCGDVFVQADAIRYLKTTDLSQFDIIWASPPCQRYTSLRHAPGKHRAADLIGPTRDALIETGKPWVIDNVEEARDWLRDPVLLCGSAVPPITATPTPRSCCMGWDGEGKAAEGPRLDLGAADKA
jgi:hypothetical protein